MSDVTQLPLEPRTVEDLMIERLEKRVAKLERLMEFIINSCPEAHRFMGDFTKQERS